MDRLLNVSKVKKFLLEAGKLKYAHTPEYIPTRVSKEFIQDLDDKVRLWIREYFETRPSKGRTIG